MASFNKIKCVENPFHTKRRRLRPKEPRKIQRDGRDPNRIFPTKKINPILKKYENLIEKSKTEIEV
ncbi:MAG: hypothetical protein KAR87_02410 [Candidatus Aenigmarchaeota archaeon]|nr:hypothetical protein [Candidatus Aenigmarchaeota archaeon]